MKLYIALVYFITDRGFNYDLYITDIGKRVFQWMESNKNRLWTFYTWAKWKVLANQAELISSLIKFKRDIKRVICKKSKQSEYPINKVMIIEYSICEEMVEEKNNYYCSLVKEIDLTIFIDIL